MNYLLCFLLLICSFVSISHAKPHFLAISDIHYGRNNQSQDGEDTGSQFLNLALKKMNRLGHEVDFILNLGDLPAHLLWFTSRKAEYERKVFHDLYEADPGKPMFYITGNNDSLAGNYQAFESKGISPLNLAPNWTGACLYCKDLLIDSSNMRHGGYYSSYVMPKNKDIILIALNTMPWANRPFAVAKYPNQRHDALNELAWLDQQLKKHHAKQLLIAMHIPPGNSYRAKPLWQEDYLHDFISILARHYHAYGQISLLSGHTHMDEIRKIHLPGKGFIYVYSIPGISRIHHNNPGMKVVTLSHNMRIENYTTYYTPHVAQWNNEYYQALGTKKAIFPYCRTDLASCLDALSNQQVCHALEKGRFYAVMSSRVPSSICKTTYPVLSHGH